MKQFVLGVVVAAGLTLPAFGQGVDPIIGTWNLNVEKSTGDLIPKSQTLVFTRDGQDFIDNSEAVSANGQALTLTYRHIYDGQPHPTTGIQNYDLSAYSRIGNTINDLRFKQGKLVEVSQVVIVPGRTYMNTMEGIDASGQQRCGSSSAMARRRCFCAIPAMNILQT